MNGRKIGVDTRNLGRPSQFNWHRQRLARLVSCLSQFCTALRDQLWIVVNAGSAEGLRAWQLFVERYDPHIRSRTAGQFLSLHQFDFCGDMLAKLEA